MVIPNGTRDALQSLRALAVARGKIIPQSWLDPSSKEFCPNLVGRRGSSDDGGKSGRLVLLGNNTDNEEISVQWCNTGEPTIPFKKLD